MSHTVCSRGESLCSHETHCGRVRLVDPPHAFSPVFIYYLERTHVQISQARIVCSMRSSCASTLAQRRTRSKRPTRLTYTAAPGTKVVGLKAHRCVFGNVSLEAQVRFEAVDSSQWSVFLKRTEPSGGSALFVLVLAAHCGSNITSSRRRRFCFAPPPPGAVHTVLLYSACCSASWRLGLLSCCAVRAVRVNQPASDRGQRKPPQQQQTTGTCRGRTCSRRSTSATWRRGCCSARAPASTWRSL